MLHHDTGLASSLGPSQLFACVEMIGEPGDEANTDLASLVTDADMCVQAPIQ